MSRIARQTAEAFGDEPGRDFEAEFGATVAPKLTASAKVGPVLQGAVSAPKPTSSAAKPAAAFNTVALSAKAPAVVKVTTAAKPPVVKAPVVAAPAAIAKAATTAAATAIKAGAVKVSAPLVPAGMSAPTSAQKAAAAVMLSPANLAAAAAAPNVIRAPAPTSSAAKPGNATTAQTGNFLDGGGAPLAMPNVKDPRTDAQKAADLKAQAVAAAAKVKADAQKTASANVKYQAERAAELKRNAEFVKRMQTEDSPEARKWRADQKFIASAGLDWNQLAAGGAVIAAGAAAIATGGALAGALAVPSVAGITGAAVAADRLIASAEKAKLLPSGASAAVGNAKAVLDTTLKLAEAGVPDAMNGAIAIANAAKERVLNGALPGVPQALTPQGASSLAGYVQGASPAVQAALATPMPSGYVTLSTKPAPAIKKRTVAWFVSTTGKVTRGDVLLGKGFRVYSDGAVVKQ